MNTSARLERLWKSVDQAIARLAESARRRPAGQGHPTPGDVYVAPLPGAAPVEWLIVREHPDEQNCWFTVPIDDFFLVGSPDVRLAAAGFPRPMVARCGQGLWAQGFHFPERLRVDRVPPNVLEVVRQRIADLVLGRMVIDEEQRQADCDPEYEDWMQSVAAARAVLEAVADQAVADQAAANAAVADQPLVTIRLEKFSTAAPPELAATPNLSLAAEPGDKLLTDLDQAVADADRELRFMEVPWSAPGKLILVASEAGVQVVGVGAEKLPVVQGRDRESASLTAAWRQGPAGLLSLAQPSFPWIDGTVVISLRTSPAQTIVVHR